MKERLSVEAGQRIGNYVIEVRLGEGAEGNVFLARDSLLGRRVALKTPRSGRAGETHGMEEARTMARLEHPHIVRVYHADRHDGVWFIAYEYVEGGTVEEWVRQSGPLSMERALEVTLQAAKGLAYAHRLGILHRDIKPHNLMMSTHGQVKIGDFGLSLDVRSPSAGHGPPVGTPAFLAPELWAGESPTIASDVYSLGACLYFLLFGRPPFRASDVDQLRRAHLELEPKIGPRVPSGTRDLVLSMLAKRPEQRPSTHGDLIPALAQLAGNPTLVRPVSQVRDPAAPCDPFVSQGVELGLRAALAQSHDHGSYRALVRGLRARLPLVTVRAIHVQDARLLVLAAVSAFSPTCAFASRVALPRGPDTAAAVLARSLGLSPGCSPEMICDRLRRVYAPPEGMGIVEIYSPQGLLPGQLSSVQVLTPAARDKGLCIVHVLGEQPLPDRAVSAATLAGGVEVVLGAGRAWFGEFVAQLHSWASAATGGRFRFSADGARLLQHLCDEEARPWTELARDSVLVAAATRNHVVTSWAILTAHASNRPLRDLADVQGAACRRPRHWPTAEVVELLRWLRTEGEEGEPLTEAWPHASWGVPAVGSAPSIKAWVGARDAPPGARARAASSLGTAKGSV